MSEVIREAMEGQTGRAIRDVLLELIESLDQTTLRKVNTCKPYTEVQYAAGAAAGARLALEAIFREHGP
jgi:hypothetical protein